MIFFQINWFNWIIFIIWIFIKWFILKFFIFIFIFWIICLIYFYIWIYLIDFFQINICLFIYIICIENFFFRCWGHKIKKNLWILFHKLYNFIPFLFCICFYSNLFKTISFDFNIYNVISEFTWHWAISLIFIILLLFQIINNIKWFVNIY